MKKILIALLPCLLFFQASQAASLSSENYIPRLRKAVGLWQSELPALNKSASMAADRIIAGGNFYACGTQESFNAEANGRSGGLMLEKALSPATDLGPKDVVLAAVTQTKEKDFDAMLEKITASGAQLVIFSNTFHPENKQLSVFPLHPPSAPKSGFSVESVSNIIGMWAWTGEFVRACLQRGKMPCMFESVGMPGGPLRDAFFRPFPFHAYEVANDKDIPDLGQNFLTVVSGSLARLEEKNIANFQRSATLLKSSRDRNQPVVLMAMAHMFPAEMTSNPTPSWISAARLNYVPVSTALPIYLGYQAFPWDVAALSGKERVPSIITTSRGPTRDWVQDAGHIYIDPCWEIQDATVKVPNYDIMILPLSGIMQSAIFWQLMEEVGPLPGSSVNP